MLKLGNCKMRKTHMAIPGLLADSTQTLMIKLCTFSFTQSNTHYL